jgi:hypothetical protein
MDTRVKPAYDDTMRSLPASLLLAVQPRRLGLDQPLQPRGHRTFIFLRHPHRRSLDGWPDPHVHRGHGLLFLHVSLQLLMALAHREATAIYTLYRLYVKACRAFFAEMHHPDRWQGEIQGRPSSFWRGMSGGCAKGNHGRSMTWRTKPLYARPSSVRSRAARQIQRWNPWTRSRQRSMSRSLICWREEPAKGAGAGDHGERAGEGSSGVAGEGKMKVGATRSMYCCRARGRIDRLGSKSVV